MTIRMLKIDHRSCIVLGGANLPGPSRRPAGKSLEVEDSTDKSSNARWELEISTGEVGRVAHGDLRG